MEDKSIYNKKKTGRKTRQKGFGWYGSLNPNAGDVEKNVEMFNAAQPDGTIGAVSPVNGGPMGEALQMSDGMVEDDFFTFERDNITYHFFFNPGRRTENKFAILAVDYGFRFDKEPYKNDRGTTTIPVSRVHNKPQQVGYFEFTSESHPEIIDAMEEEDRKEYRDLIVAEMAKHTDLKEEATYYTQPDGSWNRDNSAELDAERKDRESHKDASKRVKVIDPKDYNKYKTGTVGEVFIDRHGDEIYRVKLDDDVQDRYIPFKKEQLKFIGNEGLEEATSSKKYSYTGPIYHLGNKIAEKSRMFTMAKSFKQAINNFRYKAANGDIIGHYDIVDEFVKEVEAPETVSTIEEKPEIIKCDNCGTELNSMGDCPVCDYGEDDLLESIHVDSNLDALSQLNRMEEIV